MGVKPDLLQGRRKEGWGYLRKGCLEWYVGLKGKVTQEWRGLYYEEDHNLYSSQNIVWDIKQTIYVGYVARMGKGVVHSFCSGNPNSMTQFGRPRHWRVDNIKIDIQETGLREWIRLIWLRTGTWGKLLQKWWTFGFDKMCRVCWLDKELLAFQEGLYSMELNSQSVSQSFGYLS